MTFALNSFAAIRPPLFIARKIVPERRFAARYPRLQARRHPWRYRNCPHVTAFADHIRKNPVFLSLLKMLELRRSRKVTRLRSVKVTHLKNRISV